MQNYSRLNAERLHYTTFRSQGKLLYFILMSVVQRSEDNSAFCVLHSIRFPCEWSVSGMRSFRAPRSAFRTNIIFPCEWSVSGMRSFRAPHSAFRTYHSFLVCVAFAEQSRSALRTPHSANNSQLL